MAPNVRWIWLLYFILDSILQIASKELRIVCYYTNWSVYRPGSAKFNPQNINPYLCTHLIYAFGGFTKENTLKPFDKYQDIEKGGYAKFTGLKTYNKNLKTMLAIGGWNEGSSRFSPMVASAERRKELVKNVVKFLRQNHFDGLDLDWEYPSFRDGGKPRDRDNYAQLVQELREEFERESQKTGRTRLILTMAVPAGIEYINKGYDVPKLMKYLDWMNILSYDYHSAFEPSVNHHAPLYPLEEDNEYNYDTELNIDYTIKHYLEAGAISDKLVLGIPTYGRSYTLFNPDATEIGAPADGPGEMGDATRENGYLAYYEICEAVNNGEWTVVQPNEDAMGPYAYRDNQWVGYDDVSIARKKSQYVADKDLGGIMFWAIDNDDFRGTCHNRSFPIIEAAKEALIESLGLTEENAISKQPIKPPIKSRGRTRAKTTSKTVEIPKEKERTQNSGGRQSSDSLRKRVVNRTRNNNSNNNNNNNIESSSSPRGKRRRRPTTKKPTQAVEERRETGSSLVVTPSYTTPAPPSTPDPGGDFKCEDEGFYPHPRDCKKYFWCLSGPSELGIIAHQFTCPAGLYFNKAASSCDYTQNVLCNKKKSTTPKPTSPVSETTEQPKSESTTKKAEVFAFSTRKPLPKITAATSRTTFVSTTAEPEYYDEYEYEDEDENDNAEEAEDPQVIKELLELIKKAGGIEELEKQLNIKGEASQTSPSEGTTTSSSLSKKLYERVLARTRQNQSITSKNQNAFKYNSINRNSRGPQNEGIVKDDKEDTNTGRNNKRPQYSTISRQRNSKISDDSVDDDKDKEEENDEDKQQGRPKYVSLRRNRPSTSTENPENDDDEEEANETKSGEKRSTTSTSRSPYVTLRRSRPSTSTTEEATHEETSEASKKRRPVKGDDELDEEGNDTSSPNYVTIHRFRSTTPEASTSKYKELVRSTPQTAEATSDNSTETTATTQTPNNDTNSLVSDANTNQNLTSVNEETQNTEPKFEIKPPKLLEPRPFSFNGNVRTTTAKPATTEKVTTATKKTRRPPVARFRPEYRRGTTSSTTSTEPSPTTPRARTTRRRLSTVTSTTTAESKEIPTLPTRGPNRFRLVTRKHFLRRPKPTEAPVDQSSDSSNQQSKEEKTDADTTELTELALALQSVQNAPLRSTPKSTISASETTNNRDRASKSFSGSGRGNVNYLQEIAIKGTSNRPSYSTTIAPFRLTTTKYILRRQRPAEAFEKISPIAAYTYKPISEYDYYDDGDTRIVSSIPEHSKVLIHSTGVIQCLDQGNFPHPVSCKKFISCAKMETGNVLGWEYTCPKNLSFDPVGGMCNWSAGLGCEE